MNPIDEYIRAQKADIQPRLEILRDIIRNAIPKAEEKISYGMPTYWRGCNIIHFAAMKNHIGIYPGDEAVSAFSDRLTEYKTSKGTIRFPYDKELPLELIAEIAEWSYKKNAK